MLITTTCSTPGDSVGVGVGEGGRVAVGTGVVVSVLRMTVAVAVGDGGGGVSVALGVLVRVGPGGVAVTSADGEEDVQLAFARASRRKARMGREMLWAGLTEGSRACHSAVSRSQLSALQLALESGTAL